MSNIEYGDANHPDVVMFATNPNRRFLLRETTAEERKTGCKLVAVFNVDGQLFLRTYINHLSGVTVSDGIDDQAVVAIARAEQQVAIRAGLPS